MRSRLLTIAALESAGSVPWPAAPTRDQVCAVAIGFQGVTIQSAQFGTFPAFGPETSTLNDSDLLSYFEQVKAQGWTHVEFAVSWNYQEPGYSYPVPGRDLSQNLPELKRRIVLAIQAGLFVALFCAGDGESVNADPQPGQYNDSQGWTYGRQWLMQNFARIYAAMGPTAESAYDCRPFMVFVPGYDGCWYGWNGPQAVIDWWTLCRQSLTAGGYQGFEYGAGLCTLGDSVNAYAPNTGQQVDVFLQEFPVGPLPSSNPDQVWQILGRMVSPYHRPPDQPSGDDPHPPYLLATGTPRGPFYYIAYEFDCYLWVRNRISVAQVNQDRAYVRACGAVHVC